MSISFSSLHLPLFLSISFPSSISLIHSLYIFSTRKGEEKEGKNLFFPLPSRHVVRLTRVYQKLQRKRRERGGVSERLMMQLKRKRRERDEEEGCWKKRRKRGRRREQTKKKGMEGGMMPKMDRIFEITRLFLIFVIRIKGNGREEGGLIERTRAKSEKDESIWNGWSEEKRRENRVSFGKHVDYVVVVVIFSMIRYDHRWLCPQSLFQDEGIL